MSTEVKEKKTRIRKPTPITVAKITEVIQSLTFVEAVEVAKAAKARALVLEEQMRSQLELADTI